MRQFLTTLSQIANSESVGTFEGFRRHLQWQMRRLLNDFPCDLSIAGSKLHVEKPRGIAALVNAMGTYDYNNMHLVKALLGHLRGTFIDVGANIGAYTLVASEVSEANVVSVEPHPQTFAILVDNVRLNRRYNVTCLNVALSERNGELRLTDEAEPELNHVVASGDGAGPISVASRRLETLCRQLNVIPEVLKIDVEGHQQPVLNGMGQHKNTVKVILIEGGNESRTKQWLEDAGYTGPWFMHFKQKLLSNEKQARPEDPVFVRREFLPEFEAMGINVRLTRDGEILRGAIR